jgi:hypothetical protein
VHLPRYAGKYISRAIIPLGSGFSRKLSVFAPLELFSTKVDSFYSRAVSNNCLSPREAPPTNLFPTATPPDWQPEAVELMARENISLREAATRLQIPLTSQEIITVSKRASFQKALRAAQNAHFQEIAADPSYSRRSVIGKMLFFIERLSDEGEYRDAVEGLLKVARVEGWLNETPNINVFNNLTDQELNAIKQRAAERVLAAGTSPASKPLA